MTMAGLLWELGFENIRTKRNETWASCPAHHDSGDSWSINNVSGLHLCYACNYRGDLAQLILDARPSATLRQADKLIHDHAVDLEDFAVVMEAVTRPAPPVTREFVPMLRYAEFSAPPPEELAGRRISASAATHYGIRWKEKNGGTWILPIRTPGNTLLGWQEKAAGLVRTLPPGVTKSATLFGAEHLGTWPDVVVVESPLDAARLYTLGYLGVAAFGAFVSDDQARLLMTYAQNIILCLDNDDAGRKWTNNLLNERTVEWSARLPLHVVDYGARPVKDVGDMEDDDVITLLAEAPHVLTWQREQRKAIVQRDTAAVPKTGRGAHAQAKEPARRPQHGARQDSVRHRRHRGAH